MFSRRKRSKNPGEKLVCQANCFPEDRWNCAGFGAPRKLGNGGIVSSKLWTKPNGSISGGNVGKTRNVYKNLLDLSNFPLFSRRNCAPFSQLRYQFHRSPPMFSYTIVPRSIRGKARERMNILWELSNAERMFLRNIRSGRRDRIFTNFNPHTNRSSRSHASCHRSSDGETVSSRVHK